MPSNESLENLMKKYSDELYKYNSLRKSKPISNITNSATVTTQEVSTSNQLDSTIDDEYVTEVNVSLSELPPRIPRQPEVPANNSSNTTESTTPTKQGKILVQVFTARRTMPVPNASVDIYYSSTPTKKVVDTLITDDSGKTDHVIVPAVPKELSELPQSSRPYTTYNVNVSHPDFADVNVKNVSVFEDITAVLDIDMMPNDVAPNGESNDYVVIEPSDL